MHHLMKHWNGGSLGLRTSSTSKGLWPWPLFLLAIGILPRTVWGLLFVDQYYLLETWTCSQSRHEGGVIQSRRTPTAAIGQPQWQQRDKIEQIGDGEEHGEWRRTRRQDRLSLSGSFRLHFKGNLLCHLRDPVVNLPSACLSSTWKQYQALGASGGKMAGWVEPLWIGLIIASSRVLSSFLWEIERQEALVIVPSHHGIHSSWLSCVPGEGGGGPHSHSHRGFHCSIPVGVVGVWVPSFEAWWWWWIMDTWITNES